jgi:hypothetical protein
VSAELLPLTRYFVAAGAETDVRPFRFESATPRHGFAISAASNASRSPASPIPLAVLAINMVGDWPRDALDPTLWVV